MFVQNFIELSAVIMSYLV